MKPKIIADKNIPFLKGAFDHVADITYLPAADITSDTVRDADALIVRTRTNCNEQLLNGSHVRHISTATIGMDHIDTDYCNAHGISYANAPGCNANSVAQYIASAVAYWAKTTQTQLSNLTMGIVGYGHVGKAVEKMLKPSGIKIILNDPPLQREEQSDRYVSLETIAEKCDIITLHVPLTHSGIDATYHLIGNEFFMRTKPSALIINAARGGVINETALLYALADRKLGDCIIDCWEGEPTVNRQLLDKALIATPHIAGYSADGKQNATQAVISHITNIFGIIPEPIQQLDSQTAIETTQEQLPSRWLESYDILRDSELLKAQPMDFESFRSNYPSRREIQIVNY